MPNRNRTGFRPLEMLGGGAIPVMRFAIDSSNGTNVFVGDVVANNAAGSVRPAAADAGVTVVGVVVGLFDSNEIPIDHPNSSTGTKYLASSTAGYADVALALPNAVFVAQGQQTLASTDIWGSVDHVAGSGDTTMGTSGHELNGTNVNTEAQCQILGILDEPGNDWGTDTKVKVRFLESVWGQVNPTVGV